MFLQRKRVTSNASRRISLFRSNWLNPMSPKKLSYRKKSNAGRAGLTGQVVIRTKGSLLRRVKLLSVNTQFRLTNPGFISTLKKTPFSNKLLALVVLPSGGSTYIPAPESLSVFSFCAFRHRRTTFTKLFFRRNLFIVSFLYSIPTFHKISNIEVKPGVGSQYARSAGCSARITKFNLSKHSALVKLPSGVQKFCSMYGLAVLGQAALPLKRKLENTKSGFWRSYGCKSITRGVARNPVDHPHGGRTKAIRYPRTPWGLTTKYK